MDPASIIGVIGVAAQVLQIINNYAEGVSGCSEEVAGLRMELFCIKSVLTQIDRDKSSISALSTDGFIKILDEARVLLESMRKSLEAEASRAQRLAQRLAWPFKRQHVRDLATSLERLKTYFITAAMNDIRHTVYASATSIKGLRLSLQEMKTMDDERSSQASIMSWLTSFDPEPAHLAALATRFEGSNEWFLGGSLKTWLSEPIDVLWLIGKPGSGKTCIAAACVSRFLTTDICNGMF